MPGQRPSSCFLLKKERRRDPRRSFELERQGRHSPQTTCVARRTSGTPLENDRLLSLDLVKGRISINGSNSQLTPFPCRYLLIHAFIASRRLAALPSCLPYIGDRSIYIYFFPNYSSAQKPSPTWSAINYCLLIRRRGGKSMSVQVCFNRTEDFMIERRKLIGFLTGCLDQIAGPSKGSRVSDGEGGGRVMQR